MKKQYISPSIESIITTPIMQGALPLNSVGQSGSVTDQTDTDWDFGGDGSSSHTVDAKTSNHIPDHFSNIWGDEEE